MERVKMEDWICREEGLTQLTRTNLEALQLQKLNVLLKKLHQKEQLRNLIPESLDCLQQLHSLPFTTPDMLRKYPNQFLCCSQSQVSRVISQATSGTTGGAKRVFYTDNDLRHTVNFFASGISEMLHSGEKCMIAFPFSGPYSLGDLIARAVESLGAVPIQAGFGQSFGEWISLIQREQPQTYIGFSVPLLSVYRLYGENFPIKRALLSGDSCPEGVLSQLPMECFPHYGSRETALGGAVTCQAFEGMHLRENHIIPEIIDEEGNILPDGCWGELVITTIGMEAMPLLRYRTGDCTRILPGPCPCGGITRRLDRVTRRESGPVSMEQLDNALFPIPWIVDYRAAFDDRLHLEVHISSPQSKDEIRAVLQKLCPEIETEIVLISAAPQDCPAYPGKRHILIKEGIE